MKIAGVDIRLDESMGLQTPVPERPMLFRPYPLRGVVARNRIVLGPMSQYLAVDGAPTDWHLVHLGQFAMGGAGIVFLEETAVEARGRRTLNCTGLYTRQQAELFRRTTNFIRDLGALPAIQLGHGGRRAAVRAPWEGRAPLDPADPAGWSLISSSAEPHGPGRRKPEALDAQQIRTHIAQWAHAAELAVDAGFDVLEIHGAHGYLINQFLSPVANRRTDGYGGDLAGRMRFALEIVEAIRKVWPKDRPLFFRASVVDGKGGHWDMDDTLGFARELRDREVDVMACSSGGQTGSSDLPSVPRVPGYHVPYSEAVRRETGLATVGLGLITEPQQADDLLTAGQADLIAVAREMLVDPYWPVHAARALGVQDWINLLPPVYANRLLPRETERAQFFEATQKPAPWRRGQNLPARSEQT